MLDMSEGAGTAGRKATGPPSAPQAVKPAMDPGQGGVAERRRRAVSAGHRHDGDIAGALVDDPDPSVRVAALGALARMDIFDADILRQALADPEPAVRRRACEEAGRLLGRSGGAPPDAAPLVAVLTDSLSDVADAVVEAAAWALGEAGADASGAVDALVGLSSSSTAAECREAAVAALGAIGDDRGLEAVLARLDDKPAIRRRAAVALAAFDDPRAEAGLRQAAGDRDWQVRQVAEELLAEG